MDDYADIRHVSRCGDGARARQFAEEDSMNAEGQRMDARERYYEDPAFRALTDTLTNIILKGEFSPSEVRIAAVLAAVNAEIMRPAGPIVITQKEADELGLEIR